MHDLKALQRRFVEEFQTERKADVADELLADGDKVVTYKTFHGTHEGEMMGIPGTGNQFAVDVMDIVRYRDGRVVEHWNVVDQIPLLRAIGVIPS